MLTIVNVYYADLPHVPTRTLHHLLSAHGRDCPAEHSDAVRAYAGLLHDLHGPYSLMDAANRVIRDATREETQESALTPEGYIVADGRVCWVAP